MKRISLLLAAIALALPLAGCNKSSSMKSDDQKLSYGIGLQFGQDMKQRGIELDANAFASGIKDGQSGAKPKISIEELQQIMMAKQQQMMAAREKETSATAAKSLAEGQKFLADNKAKSGVKTTASGLQYEVLTEGKGKKPTAKSTVTVNYKGTLTDGTEFDSSYKRNQPAQFPVGGVIPGWTEGLQLMSEGSKYRFVIPSNLAYGERGEGSGVIPGNAVLVFEVELLKVD